MSWTESNQADLLTHGPRVEIMWREWDEELHERAQRRNGAYQCPKCGLWWPNMEEPDMWEQDDNGWWQAIGWFGAAVCGECHLLMLDQPDGESECYQL